jgi:hypothetical protein
VFGSEYSTIEYNGHTVGHVRDRTGFERKYHERHDDETSGGTWRDAMLARCDD